MDLILIGIILINFFIISWNWIYDIDVTDIDIGLWIVSVVLICFCIIGITNSVKNESKWTLIKQTLISKIKYIPIEIPPGVHLIKEEYKIPYCILSRYKYKITSDKQIKE